MQSFIFNSLKNKELKTVIDSFEEKNINREKCRPIIFSRYR